MPTFQQTAGLESLTAHLQIARQRTVLPAMAQDVIPNDRPVVWVVDDVADNRKLLEETLEEEGYAVVCSSSGFACLELADKSVPDLVLLDVMMPGLNGIDTCRQLKRNPAMVDVPVVMVSAANQEDLIVEALDAGAHDYICKPIVERIVSARSRSALRVKTATDENKRLVAELGIANEKLRTMSREDALLGIGNRRALEEDLEQVHGISLRHGRQYCVSLIDVDHFKLFNDHYGHPAGDEALRDVAEVIGDCIRDTDRLYRYGGEELLVIHPETPAQGNATFAQRMCRAVEYLALPHAHSAFSYLTVSVGVGFLHEDDTSDVTVAQVLRRADKALYAAKAAGRNQIQIADACAVDLPSLVPAEKTG